LKTISGFSQKEIAASLLLKEDTVKKRLSRARKTIIEKGLEFKIPNNEQLPARLDRVQQVLYLIFNEGFHSIQQAYLVREDLCAEAMRLCKMLLQNPLTQQPSVHAHFALMCFNLARLNSKTNTKGEVISLKEQDRTSWDHHLVTLGHFNMGLAVETKTFSSYHFEAAIAAEHVSAKTWNNTNWQNILQWYDQLNAVQPSPFNDLNRAVIFVHLNDFDKAKQTLMAVEPTSLEQRAYLYYGLWAEFFYKSGLKAKALANVNKAISMVSNKAEKEYLLGKKAKYLTL
ncbi:MAG: RNA polymerase sigma factor, partial [Bacteroidia bacterium]